MRALVRVVVVEMNIIKVALSHFCCRTTVQSDSVSVSSQAGDSSSLVDSTKHIVSQPERTTDGTAQSSVPVERQEEKAHPEPVAAECSMLVRQPPEMSDRQRVVRRVGGTRVDVSADRRRCRVPRLVTGWMVSAR